MSLYPNETLQRSKLYRGVTFCCDGREKAFVNRDRNTKHTAFVKTKCTPAGK